MTRFVMPFALFVALASVAFSLYAHFEKYLPLRAAFGDLERENEALVSKLASQDTASNRMIIASANLFEPASSALSQEGLARVSAAAAEITEAGYGSVSVAAFAHEAVPPQDDWELSALRAVAVARALVADGIDEGKLAVSAYGATRPIVSGDSEESFRQNSRVEIVVR